MFWQSFDMLERGGFWSVFKLNFPNPELPCLDQFLFSASFSLSSNIPHVHLQSALVLFLQITFSNNVVSTSGFGICFGTFYSPSRSVSFCSPLEHGWPLFSVSWSYTQPVGHLGRGISPSQGRYLHAEQHNHRINAHRQPCLEWDSNPWHQCSSGRRRFMP
jgi:hypothetical protein